MRKAEQKLEQLGFRFNGEWTRPARQSRLSAWVWDDGTVYLVHRLGNGSETATTYASLADLESAVRSLTA